MATRWHSSPQTGCAGFTTGAQRVVMIGTTLDSSHDRGDLFGHSLNPFSLLGVSPVTRLQPTLNDPRLKRLRDLIQEVVRLQENTKRLILELGEQIRNSETRGKTWPTNDRRRKPRR